MRLLTSCLVLLLAASCAHSAPAEPATPPPGGEAPPPEDNSPVVTPAEVAWKDMTKEQRGRYMKKVVMPKMRDLFVAFDPETFKKPSCATCHGKNPKEKKFKMPSDDLPALPASEKEFMATVMKDKPQMVKFMNEQVSATMAELLGVKRFDPKAPDENAFSCHNCHTLKGQPDPAH